MLTLIFACAIILLLICFVFIYASYRPIPQQRLALDINKQLYHQRVVEIEREYLQGLHSDKQALLSELQLSLLQDSQSELKVFDKLNPGWLRVSAIILLIVVSVVSYLKTGGWQEYSYQQAVINRLPELRHLAQNPNGKPLSMIEMQQLALAVRSGLQQHPGNINDWMLLGDINVALQDYNTTLQAFSKAYQLAPADPYIQQLYGQMLLKTSDQANQQLGQQLLQQVISRDQHNLAALSALAFYAFSQADYNQAISLWQRMLPWIDNQQRKQIIEISIQRAREAMQ